MTEFPLEVNSPQYWDAMYEEEAKSNQGRYSVGRYNMILGYVKPNSKVLDFGCGTGIFLEWLKKRRPQAKLRGVDFSRFAIKEAKKRCKKNEYILGSKIANGPYDLIICMHVLEHFSNPDYYIEQAYNNLADDGNLVIVFPMYDKPWVEHLKIWTLDFLRLFMKQQKKWRWIIIHRPETGYFYKSGEAMEEALVFCQKIPVPKA